ncbi:MAG: Lrp/AsnC ligand binding domain-containing protein [Candidatus Bathyarchaeia archaeon]
MLKAFILIRVGERKAYSAAYYKEVFSKIKGVEEVHVLFGQYDFILKIQAENVDALAQIVDNEIRIIPGVHSTETFIAY